MSYSQVPGLEPHSGVGVAVPVLRGVSAQRTQNRFVSSTLISYAKG